MAIDMTYRESLAYLNQFVNYEVRPPTPSDTKAFHLAEFDRFLDTLGAPHRTFPSILIAGSKGKGSTAAMLAAMLAQAGMRTGLYTSPHLVTIRERVQVDRQLINQQAFATLMSDLRRHLEQIQARPAQNFRTFFELLTALAFCYFARQQVDIAVVEVGLGGRLDSTNVLPALLSVITPIGFEHTHILGDTLSAIASEKAGIIKPNGSVIVAPQEAEVLEVFDKRCQLRQASSYLAQRDFTCSTRQTTAEGSLIDFSGFGLDLRRLPVPLIGQHQVTNAAVALAAVGFLRQQGWPLDEHDIRQGLASVSWPGRLEIIDRMPCVVLDAAHTVESARCLATSLATLFTYQRLHLILGFSKDKKITPMVDLLAPMADTAIATGFSNPRAFDPHRLTGILRSHCKHVYTCEDPISALAYARTLAKPDDLICMTGSLILLGELKSRLAGLALEF